jgi:DNA-binding GntR family transcriptional regulator
MSSEATPIAPMSSDGTPPTGGRAPLLTDAAHRALRARILRGELIPGQRVTEAQLSNDMGFGLTPTREALARLSAERLVITLPRKGYLVAPVTPEGVRELFELWRPICGALAELAAVNATDAEIDELCAVVDTLGQIPSHPSWVHGH